MSDSGDSDSTELVHLRELRDEERRARTLYEEVSSRSEPPRRTAERAYEELYLEAARQLLDGASVFEVAELLYGEDRGTNVQALGQQVGHTLSWWITRQGFGR